MSVFNSFDEWWNVAITEGPQCSVRDMCKAAFECGVITGQARPDLQFAPIEDLPVSVENGFIRGSVNGSG